MEPHNQSVSQYLIAGGAEQDTWVLMSTSDKGQSKQNMNLDGDDVLLEFLRGVIAKGGRVIVEIPGSAPDHQDSAGLGHHPPLRRTETK